MISDSPIIIGTSPPPAIIFKVGVMMLRTGARFISKFSGSSAEERDFLRKWDKEDELQKRNGIGSIH